MKNVKIELSKEEIKIILQSLNSVSVQGLSVMEKILALGNKLSKAVSEDGISGS